MTGIDSQRFFLGRSRKKPEYRLVVVLTIVLTDDTITVQYGHVLQCKNTHPTTNKWQGLFYMTDFSSLNHTKRPNMLFRVYFLADQ
jgi:hypothetical protein